MDPPPARRMTRGESIFRGSWKPGVRCRASGVRETEFVCVPYQQKKQSAMAGLDALSAARHCRVGGNPWCSNWEPHADFGDPLFGVLSRVIAESHQFDKNNGSPACAEDDERGSRAFGFGLRASGFRLQASGFRLQASGFRLPASGFRLPASFQILNY